MSNAQILFRVMNALHVAQRELTEEQQDSVEELFAMAMRVLSGEVPVRPRPDVVTSQARLVASLIDSIDTVLQPQGEGVSPDAFFALGGAMALCLLLQD